MHKETPQFDEKMLAAMFQHVVGKLDPDRLTKQEIEEFLAKITEYMKGVKAKMEEDMGLLRQALAMAQKNMKDSMDTEAKQKHAEMVKKMEDMMNKMYLDHESMMSMCEMKMREMEEMKEEHDEEMMGMIEEKMKAMIPAMPELKPETPESIRAKAIESKLNINELDGIDELKDQFRSMIPQRSIGAMGGSVVHKFIDDETPSGTINSSNVTFYLAKTPINGSLKLYLGGARQRVTEDFTLSGKTITFTIAPDTGSVLLADYRHY